MSMRREEEGMSRGIELKVGKGIMGPGMSGQITDVWAEVGGARVTEVEEGRVFDIKAKYTASWPDKPLIIVNWVVGISARGDGISIYDNTNMGNVTSKSGEMTIDNPSSPKMPAHNIALTIQIWGSGHSTDYYKPPWE